MLKYLAIYVGTRSYAECPQRKLIMENALPSLRTLNRRVRIPMTRPLRKKTLLWKLPQTKSVQLLLDDISLSGVLIPWNK